MGQSALLCEAHLLKPGLSLVWSLMGQSPLLCEAHLLQPGLSLMRSLMGQSPPLSDPESHGSVSFAVQGSFVRVEPLSGLAFPTLIALSSDPRSSPARQ